MTGFLDDMAWWIGMLDAGITPQITPDPKRPSREPTELYWRTGLKLGYYPGSHARHWPPHHRPGPGLARVPISSHLLDHHQARHTDG